MQHQAPVNDAQFSPNGRFVVTASADRTAAIWDSNTGVRLRTLRAPGAVLAARFSPDGKIVVTGDVRGHVQLWSSRWQLLATGNQRGAVTDVAFAADGGVFATAGSGGATLWSLPSGKRIRPLGAPGGVSRVAFSPDGSLVAGAGEHGAAWVWNAETGSARKLKVSKKRLTDVVFSPDGSLLLVTGPNVRTFNPRTGALVNELVGHTGGVAGGAFSPDGRWIVTAGPATVILWQSDSDRPYHAEHDFYLRAPGTVSESQKNKHLTSASFSPDGRLVLSSSEDGTVRLYRCKVCGDLPALLKLARGRLRELRR